MLLLGALPLVLNVKAAEGIEDVWEMLDTIHRQLQGTCIGYSEPAETPPLSAVPALERS